MKKLITLLALSLLMIACQNPAAEPITNSEETEEPKEESYRMANEVDYDQIFLIGEPVLIDDTGYGFSYAANNATDQDFSTAWCPAPDNEYKAWSIHFQEQVIPGNVGMIAGFARDEEIYFQNNRVKTLRVRYDGKEMGEIELEDLYAMQFPELPQEPVSQIDLFITDVYEGSKYDDVCMAEIDFWSDYVHDKDAEAAYDFYLENKASTAIRPVNVNYTEVIPVEALADCGAQDPSYKESIKSTEPFWVDEIGAYNFGYGDGQWIILASDVAFSARMNGSTSLTDEFSIQWLYATGENLTWTLHKETIVTPNECSDGALFLSDLRPDDHPFIFRGQQRIDVIYQGEIISSTFYTIPQ